jgi:CRISPR-associated protein Cmr4
MKYNLYNITTKANTHVGSGQNSYGIVDNVVQRDYNTAMPIILSSSLKGALKEWLTSQLDKGEEASKIFGNEVGEGQQGSHYVFPAFLASLPMRSSKHFYFNVTCPAIAKEMLERLSTTDITKYNEVLAAVSECQPATNFPISINGYTDVIIEKHQIKTVEGDIQSSSELKELFGNNVAIMNNDQFYELVKRLPIIARNKLDNGKSVNLFYEEVVPRETYFSFLVGAKELAFTSDDDLKSLCQIGANASIGYGFCKLNKLA